jgi:hypothetical protein
MSSYRSTSRRLNRAVYQSPDAETARAFMERLADFQKDIVGFEHEPQDGAQADVTWQSATEKREWKLADLVYKFLACTFVLDGWIGRPPQPTEHETAMLAMVQRVEALARECAVQAERVANAGAISIVQRIQVVLRLWRTCIHFRWSVDCSTTA